MAGILTQRLVVTIILMDILLFLVLGFANGLSEQTVYNQMETTTNHLDDIESDFQSKFPEETIDTENDVVTNDFGDVKAGGRTIFTIFNKLTPPPGVECDGVSCGDDRIAYWFSWGIILFYGLINTLLIIEAYMFFVNRKT